MGFFQDVAGFGTNVSRQVNSFVAENAGGVPVVGDLLTTGANIQLKQLEAIDKATGNVKKTGTAFDVNYLINSKATQKQLLAEKEKKDKEKKIIIYSFVVLGIVLASTIAYLQIRKKT